jgi:hypothetical protein
LGVRVVSAGEVEEKKGTSLILAKRTIGNHLNP